MSVDSASLTIHYTADDAQEVYLVWKPYTSEARDLLLSNPGSRQDGDLIYSPMTGSDGDFVRSIQLPDSEQLYYCFWITRGDEASYRDFWDTRAGATVRAADKTLDVTGSTEAALMTDEQREHGAYGPWMLLASLLLFGAVAAFRRPGREVNYHERIIGAGLAAMAFHLAARFEIVDFSPRTAAHHPFDTLVQLLAVSFEDLLLVGGITLVGSMLLAIVPRSDKQWMALTWTLLLLLVTVLAQVNVDTVDYMGYPFTYQWLYYSDFLTATDAWAAISEQSSTARVVNIITISLSVIFFGRIVERVADLLPRTLSAILLPGTMVFGLVAATMAHHLQVPDVNAGQRKNAVVAFLDSMVDEDDTAAFGRLALPAGALPFRERGEDLAAMLSRDESLGIKNVVLIVLESAAGIYFDGARQQEHVTEPLRQYADRTLYFDQFYANAPSTNCSMVSLVTGLYPKLSYQSVTREFTTHPFISLPGELHRAGFRTSFFTSADLDWQQGLEFLEHRDFDVVEDFRAIACDRKFNLHAKHYDESAGIDDHCLANRLSDWVGVDDARPFLSVLWTVQTHYPYYFDGPEHAFEVDGIPENRYLNGLRHGTDLVQQVLEDLERQGVADSTLVVVTGDHGESFGQHGHSGHGNTLYEEDLRVPLYLIFPRPIPRHRYGHLGTIKDLPTTILPLVNQPVPDKWQGNDLLRTAPEEAFYFSPWTQLYFGYRNGDRKFIFNETNQSVKVFDLAADPREERDIAQSISEEEMHAARLRLATWIQHQSALYDAIE